MVRALLLLAAAVSATALYPLAASAVPARAVTRSVASRTAGRLHPPGPCAVTMMSGDDGKGSDEENAYRDSLYSPSFELDATTVLALLGGAIAFNFFVLANL